MKVKIMCGISGSGKSTYVKNNFPTAEVCSADNYFMMDGEYKFDQNSLSKAHSQCLRKFVDCVLPSTYPVGLSAEIVVVDNTNTTVTEIAPYAALALAYGHDLEIVILEFPDDGYTLDKIAARNVHNVLEHVVQAQCGRLDDLIELKQLPRWWKVTRVPVKGL